MKYKDGEIILIKWKRDTDSYLAKVIGNCAQIIKCLNSSKHCTDFKIGFIVELNDHWIIKKLTEKDKLEIL